MDSSWVWEVISVLCLDMEKGMPELQGFESHFPKDPFLVVGPDDLEVFSNTKTVKTFI